MLQKWTKEKAKHKLKNVANILPISPIQYWKMNEHRFPALAPMARDIMGVPASSANIKRAFSTAVDIKSAKRNKIKAALFHMLLFIKKNSIFFLLNLNV